MGGGGWKSCRLPGSRESFDSDGPCTFWAFADERGTKAAWGTFQQWILSKEAHVGNCIAFLELARKQNCRSVCSQRAKGSPIIMCKKSNIWHNLQKRKSPFQDNTKRFLFFFFGLSSTQLAGEGSVRATRPLCRPTNLPHFPSTVVTGLTHSQRTSQYCRINIFQQKIVPLENLSGSPTIHLETFCIHQYAEHIHTLFTFYNLQIL